MGIVNFLDRQLIRFANHRASKMSRQWIAIRKDGGEWKLGLCKQKDAESRVNEGGKNKIIYVDPDLSFIFYE